jgi:CRP/FNR family cyclic AMP-dependent transcriptional regulator
MAAPGRRAMEIQPLIMAVQAERGADAFRVQLTPAQWQCLGHVLQRRELPAGELLLRRGDADRCAYLLEAGQLQVFVTGGPPRSHRIATLQPGALVGEPALFASATRMAHVEAVTPCVVWKLCAQKLHALAHEAPALVLEVMRAAGEVMAVRMRANQERGIPMP